MKEMGKWCVGGGAEREGVGTWGCWTKERGPGQLQVHDEEALKKLRILWHLWGKKKKRKRNDRG